MDRSATRPLSVFRSSRTRSQSNARRWSGSGPPTANAQRPRGTTRSRARERSNRPRSTGSSPSKRSQPGWHHHGDLLSATRAAGSAEVAQDPRSELFDPVRSDLRFLTAAGGKQQGAREGGGISSIRPPERIPFRT